MLHAMLSVLMVIGCVCAAIAHRRGTVSEGRRVALADMLMLLMCLAMVDLAAGMIWPNGAGTYILPLWVWGALLMVSTPAMSLGHRVLSSQVSRTEQFLVLHRGLSMAAMAILVFLAHGTHDHGADGGGRAGHDHAAPLRTVLAAGFGVGVLAYLGLSVLLVGLLFRHLRQVRRLPAILKVDLASVPRRQKVGGRDGKLARQDSVVVALAQRESPVISDPVARSWPAQLHEVGAQSIAVIAMLAMML